MGWALSGNPDADLATKALDLVYEQCGKPQGLLFHCSMGAATFASVCGSTASVKA